MDSTYTFLLMKVLGSLALLMFGMKSMSEALQKMAGPQLRHVLGAMTTNRFTGMLTGIFVTAAVQSSTATTLMTVSFVSAGLLTLVQAISVIMGAHIGTTVTAWIMSLGFSFNITDFVYPAFFIGIILIYMKKRRIIGDFLFGVAFLFLGLGTLKETGFSVVQDPQASAAISAFFARFNDPNFWNSAFFLLMGTVLTLCVQSSAAIMAITMILCSTGVLHIDQGIMLVLGENIGTTITANIVAMGANTSARRAAFAHLSINVLGVTWALIFLQPFVNGVCGVVGFERGLLPGDPGYAENLAKISVVLATFHSAFNVTNTLLLIWFVPLIERFVSWVIKPKKSDDEDFRLHFIQSGIMKTPEISVLEAQKEIRSFAERMQRMFVMVREMCVEKNPEHVKKLYERIQKYEQISDNMEYEIGKYLGQVSDAHLSDETKGKIRAMLREISELESVGDSCYNICRTLQRYKSGKESFTEEQTENLDRLMDLVARSLELMRNMLEGRKEDINAKASYEVEREINNFRNELKTKNVADLDEHRYSYALGATYIDIVTECEKLADYVINVVEARIGKA
ncbi:MAG: Na/Pi cotransporter family protein [Alloprevotella sp.]|nr:Na/Pi cotransporter family protein [Alloprevotella sp.]MBR1652492.1 Na/Pi cotransporter family protein [Alloprevotella sp.]